METRAHHLLVGAFVLTLAVGAVMFTAWIARFELRETSRPYSVYISGSVTGLKEGSAVRYRGVLVGTVSEIRIDPENVERVRVLLRVDKDTPIKADATVSLEMSGLAGNAYLQITGGSQAAPLLVGINGRPPVIPSKPSPLAEVYAAAPQLLNRLLDIGDRLSRLLSPENEQRASQALANLHALSADLRVAVQNLGETMQSVKATTAQLDGAAGEIRRLTGTIGQGVQDALTQSRVTIEAFRSDSRVVMSELGQTAEEARSLSRSLRQLSDRLGGVIHENRTSIRDFTSVGLYELSHLIAELRELAATLARVSAQIERSPVDFLISGAKSGEK
ncbi:phospholipid/cholesterol/gamma-HCH transport system substrate-binding protein [Azospirillaceae bacterium]